MVDGSRAEVDSARANNYWESPGGLDPPVGVSNGLPHTTYRICCFLFSVEGEPDIFEPRNLFLIMSPFRNFQSQLGTRQLLQQEHARQMDTFPIFPPKL